VTIKITIDTRTPVQFSSVHAMSTKINYFQDSYAIGIVAQAINLN